MGVRQLIDADCILWISRQVIREFSAVVTRPQTFMTPLASFEAAALLRKVLPILEIADETDDTSEHLLTLMEQHPMGGKQIHDANIVATMQAYNITHLLTLNPVDFMRFVPKITLIRLEELLDTDDA